MPMFQGYMKFCGKGHEDESIVEFEWPFSEKLNHIKKCLNFCLRDCEWNEIWSLVGHFSPPLFSENKYKEILFNSIKISL